MSQLKEQLQKWNVAQAQGMGGPMSRRQIFGDDLEESNKAPIIKKTVAAKKTKSK